MPDVQQAGAWQPELSELAFRRIRELLEERTGIHLTEAKRRLVQNRLAPRVRKTKSKSFSDYVELIEDASCAESEHFLNALTTNVTEFFREPYHFEALRQGLLASLAESPAVSGRLRLWCAACSTGEEPYSLAITLLESKLDTRDLDVKILATDIDSRVLAHARAGVYERDRVAKIPKPELRRYFLEGRGSRSGWVRVKPEVQALVHFKQLNLFDPWPMVGPFDLIVCRNVIIYFEPSARAALLEQFHEILGPRGYLFLGHSEAMAPLIGARFEPLGHTMFRTRPRPG